MNRFYRHSFWLIVLALCSVFFPAASHSITGGQVIDRTAESWKSIQDYQAIIHQKEFHPDGTSKELWIRATLVRPTTEQTDVIPAFLLELFDHPVYLAGSEDAIAAATDSRPSKIYFADNRHFLYTFHPEANTVRIDRLDENTVPLPEFLYLAGFLQFDIETFREKFYVDANALEETLRGTRVYHVRISPRSKVKDTEPPKDVWIDRNRFLPLRFEITSEVIIQVDIEEYKVNQGITGEEIEPQVPENVQILGNLPQDY